MFLHFPLRLILQHETFHSGSQEFGRGMGEWELGGYNLRFLIKNVKLQLLKKLKYRLPLNN